LRLSGPCSGSLFISSTSQIKSTLISTPTHGLAFAVLYRAIFFLLAWLFFYHYGRGPGRYSVIQGHVSHMRLPEFLSTGDYRTGKSPDPVNFVV